MPVSTGAGAQRKSVYTFQQSKGGRGAAFNKTRALPPSLKRVAFGNFLPQRMLFFPQLLGAPLVPQPQSFAPTRSGLVCLSTAVDLKSTSCNRGCNAKHGASPHEQKRACPNACLWAGTCTIQAGFTMNCLGLRAHDSRINLSIRAPDRCRGRPWGLWKVASGCFQ